jgi:hypothetical protein
MGEFAVLAILESKSHFMWQNRIESESKSHFEISISRIESEEMPIETSENIDTDNRLLKSNKSIEGQTQNDTSLLNQWQQKSKKRKQIKRVTWNKNLTDIKLISPRVNNNNQQTPTNNPSINSQNFRPGFGFESNIRFRTSEEVQTGGISTQEYQVPEPLAISDNQPSTSFKNKCQMFKMKNKDSSLVLSFKSRMPLPRPTALGALRSD